nr:(Na+)-NQR maturation NqrM [Proteus mirabilis]
MLKIFLFAFILFLLAFFGMALGYIVKRKSIQGSCGGLGSIGIEKECDCPEPCDARKKNGERSCSPRAIVKNRIL